MSYMRFGRRFFKAVIHGVNAREAEGLRNPERARKTNGRFPNRGAGPGRNRPLRINRHR